MPRRISRTEIATVGICFLVLGMVIAPALGQRARQLSNRAYCAANLRGIAQSMNVYAADDPVGCFPYIGGSSARTYTLNFKPGTGKTADGTIENNYKGETYYNDPLAPLWILVLKNQVTPKQFICKSDPFAGEPSPISDKAGKLFDGFRDGKAESYSVTYMWAQEKENGPVTIAPWWKNVTDSSLPIMSDAAPYCGSKAKADEITTRPATAPATQNDKILVLGGGDPQPNTQLNSPNHEGQGQNVAFSDAHAEFCRRPDVGPNSDSIWTIVPGKDLDPIAPEAGDVGVRVAGGQAPYDVVMVPTRSAKGDFK